MALPLLAAAGISAIPSIISGISGIGQRRQAKRLRNKAVDPNYQMNTANIQNAETLRNRYSNYEMPGYNQALNNINSGSASAFNSGVRGASSSGDVLDLATRIAYGTGQQARQLEMTNAQGKDNALSDYLSANAAAGQEQVNANAYDRQRYQDQLAEAAALYGAGNQNTMNAATGIASIGTSLLMNPSNNSNQTMGQLNGNPNVNPAGYASAGINQQPVNTNPFVQYSQLNPILPNSRMVGVRNNSKPSTIPLIPLPR